jgi:aminocarboxymuconate-semialdehyde decarboxylase
MEAAITALGAERLLLGTDFPYQKDDVYVSAIDYVRSAKIPDAVKKGVLGETARRLFNL